MRGHVLLTGLLALCLLGASTCGPVEVEPPDEEPQGQISNEAAMMDEETEAVDREVNE